MEWRKELTQCGNGAIESNMEILQSSRPALKRVTFNPILEVPRVKECLNARCEEIRAYSDVREISEVREVSFIIDRIHQQDTAKA
jgi:hypothetical protein